MNQSELINLERIKMAKNKENAKYQTINLGYAPIAGFKKGDAIWPDWMREEEEFAKEYEEEIKDNPPNEIITSKTAKLTINYPLTNPYVTELKGGLTRQQVVEFVCKCYAKIYKEETATTKLEEKEIPGMYNRDRTDGKYGIWGHCIGDLILHSLYVKKDGYEVGVDS